MQRWLRQGLIVIVLVVVGFGALVWLKNQRDCQPMSLLFIGNSYTYGHDMPALLGELADAGEPRYCLEIETVVVGGVGLAQHWDAGLALQKVQSKQWTYVVLQEQSMGTIEAPQRFQQAASRWIQAIRQHGATPVLFVTWPANIHRNSKPRLMLPMRKRLATRQFWLRLVRLGSKSANTIVQLHCMNQIKAMQH